MPEQTQIEIAYLIPDQFWSSTVTSASEVFHGISISRKRFPVQIQRDIHIRFLRTTRKQIRGFSGFTLETEYFAEKALEGRQFDAVIVPSVWDLSIDNLRESRKALHWMKTQHENGAIVAGLVTGVFYLAEAGLLDEREATIHWASENIFKQRYPAVRLSPQLQMIESGGVITTSNTFATFDVALWLIQRYLGDRAAEFASQYFTIRHKDAPLPEYLEPATHDALVDAARDIIRTQYGQPLSLPLIASQLNVTTRTLSRRFSQAMGMSPIQYLSKQRLNIARQLLLSTDMQIQLIAEHSGFGSATVFCRQFKKAFDVSPRELRAQSH